MIENLPKTRTLTPQQAAVLDEERRGFARSQNPGYLQIVASIRPVSQVRQQALNDIYDERLQHQSEQLDWSKLDEINTRNDFVSYIVAYAGRAANCGRNQDPTLDFREMMVKVGALSLAAIEAYDRNFVCRYK